ncbi:uncharacterized protein ACIBXB_015113 [Morphnus guianensis]
MSDRSSRNPDVCFGGSSRKWREVAIPYVRCGFLGKWHPGSDEEEVRSTGTLSPALRCQSNTEVPEHRSLVMPHTGTLLRCAVPFLAGKCGLSQNELLCFNSTCENNFIS